MNDPGYTNVGPETGLTILKWAITILVAGFIAQFGKKFATFIIEKIKGIKKRKSAEQAGSQDAERPSPALPGQGDRDKGPAPYAPGKAELKSDKKMLKALAKERKKK